MKKEEDNERGRRGKEKEEEEEEEEKEKAPELFLKQRPTELGRIPEHP